MHAHTSTWSLTESCGGPASLGPLPNPDQQSLPRLAKARQGLPLTVKTQGPPTAGPPCPRPVMYERESQLSPGPGPTCPPPLFSFPVPQIRIGFIGADRTRWAMLTENYSHGRRALLRWLGGIAMRQPIHEADNAESIGGENSPSRLTILREKFVQ